VRAALSLTPAGADWPPDDGCAIGESDTTQDPCNMAVPPAPGVGVILKDICTLGVACMPFGFFAGGGSNFLTFGGKFLVVFPRDYNAVSFYSSCKTISAAHHMFCPQGHVLMVNLAVSTLPLLSCWFDPAIGSHAFP
jgi:hypothetical protein